MAKRRCKGKTKAGERCKAVPLKGMDCCLAHSDEATRAKMGFGGSENGAKGGHAKRVPRLTEKLTERVEERADEIMDQLFKGLHAERALVVGTGPKARVEIVSDQDMVLKTVREIYDRFEGRPMHHSESKVEVHTKDELDREIERLTEALAGRSNGHRQPASS